MAGVSFWRKRVQDMDMDTVANFFIVSCHHDLCPEALKQNVILALKGMEKAMFKRGLHKKMVESGST